jgi:HEAT repeat protein
MQPPGKQPSESSFHQVDQLGPETSPDQAPASAVHAILGRLGLARESDEIEGNESLLAQALSDPSWTVRIEATQKLGKMGKAAPLGLLLAALNDRQGGVRAAAARALRHNPRQAAISALVTALLDTEWVVRAEAALALGTMQEHAPVEPLMVAAQDIDASVRAAAISALEAGRTERVLALFESALQDEDWSVREAASRVLSQQEKSADAPMLPTLLHFDHIYNSSPDEIDEQRGESEAALSLATPANDPFAQWLEQIEGLHQRQLASEQIYSAFRGAENATRKAAGVARKNTRARMKRKHVLALPPSWSKQIVRLAEGLLASILIACLVIACLAIEFRPRSTQVLQTGNNSAPAFFTYREHTSGVERLAWSPDGQTVASADMRGNILIWQANTGRALLPYPYTQEGKVLTLGWNSMNTLLIVYGEPDRSLQVEEITIGSSERVQMIFQLIKLPGIPSAAAWSSDHEMLAFDAGAGFIQIWNVILNINITTLQEKNAQYAELTWSPNNTQLAALSTNGQLQTWDTYTGRHLATLANSQQATLVAWISCKPANSGLFFAGPDGTIMKWWYSHDRQKTAPFLMASTYNFANTSGLNVSALALSPDKEQLLMATSDGLVQARDAVTGNLIYLYTGHSTQVNNIEWAPDGRHIATASMDTTVQIWQEP